MPPSLVAINRRPVSSMANRRSYPVSDLTWTLTLEPPPCPPPRAGEGATNRLRQTPDRNRRPDSSMANRRSYPVSDLTWTLTLEPPPCPPPRAGEGETNRLSQT